MARSAKSNISRLAQKVHSDEGDARGGREREAARSNNCNFASTRKCAELSEHLRICIGRKNKLREAQVGLKVWRKITKKLRRSATTAAPDGCAKPSLDRNDARTIVSRYLYLSMHRCVIDFC